MANDFRCWPDPSATFRVVPPPAVGSRRQTGVVTTEAHTAHAEYRPKVVSGGVGDEPGRGQP